MVPDQIRSLVKCVSKAPGLAYFLLICSFLASSCHTNREQPIRIACAANAQYAVDEIAAQFTIETGIELEIILGSSGNLTTQIIQGAPYDAFISADMEYPQKIIDAGNGIGDIKPYALGTLVLWSTREHIPVSFEAMLTDDTKRIAIANPQLAPYGRAAVDMLKSKGLYAAIKNKLVYGESITQVNQFIASGAADIGITARSVMFSPDHSDNGSWLDFDSEAQWSVTQGCVVLSNSDQPQNARQFYDYLSGQFARDALVNHGYLPPPSK